MEGMERELKGLKMKEEGEKREGQRKLRGGEEKGMGHEGQVSDMEGRLRALEWSREREERERRGKNILIKGLKGVGEGQEELERSVKLICKEIGVEVEVRRAKRLKVGRKERGEVMLVELGEERERRQMLKNIKKLKGKEIW